MTSRKNYVAVAKALTNAQELAEAGWSAKGILDRLTEDLASVFAADNPSFDRVRFLDASRSQVTMSRRPR